MKKFKLFKEKTDFVKLLSNQCEILIKGYRYFLEYLETEDPKYADLVIKTEYEGDNSRVVFIKELDRHIVTSLDKASFFNFSGITIVARKDLFSLSRLIDEFLDYAKTAIEEIIEFKIKPNDNMKLMVKVLLNMADLMYKSVINIRKNRELSKNCAIAAKKLENEVAAISVSSIKELFESYKQPEDIIKIMKYREIYRHLNKTADIGDNVMDELLNILVTI